LKNWIKGVFLEWKLGIWGAEIFVIFCKKTS